jgi:hypothetical protein
MMQLVSALRPPDAQRRADGPAFRPVAASSQEVVPGPGSSHRQDAQVMDQAVLGMPLDVTDASSNHVEPGTMP